jgi:hypothetical protein
MKKQAPAANPDVYVAALKGWRKTCVETLRGAVVRTKLFDEAVKWGHLVYSANGPALLIRAEDERVIFGFWRGMRLKSIAPALVTGGKYQMGRLVFARGDDVDAALAKRLAVAAHALNAKFGDPTKI